MAYMHAFFKNITVAAFHIYIDQHGEDAAKRGGLRPCIKMSLKWKIMKKSRN